MPPRQQAHQQALEHRVLPDDHPLDLVQRLFERTAGLGPQLVGLIYLGHVSSVVAVTYARRPNQRSDSAPPTSSSTRAPPAKLVVISCLTCLWPR